MLLLDVTSTAIDNDTAMNIVGITSNDGNSAIVCECSGVPVVVGEVDGLGVDCEPVVDGGVGLFIEGVGLGIFVGDGLPVIVAEL